MKKLILSAIVLFLFSAAIAVFEMSCTKTANSQNPSYVLTPATTSKLGGVIPDGTTISVDAAGKISANSGVSQQGKILYFLSGPTAEQMAIYSANFDGSNPQKLNIILPNNVAILNNLKVSPDHKTIFFNATTLGGTGPTYVYIYSCNIDGSNVREVLKQDATAGYTPSMAAVY